MTDYRHFVFANLLAPEDVARLREDAEKLKAEIAELELQKKATESRMAQLMDSRQRLVRFLEQVAG